jgi:hypothetical protein
LFLLFASNYRFERQKNFRLELCQNLRAACNKSIGLI